MELKVLALFKAARFRFIPIPRTRSCGTTVKLSRMERAGKKIPFLQAAALFAEAQMPPTPDVTANANGASLSQGSAQMFA